MKIKTKFFFSFGLLVSFVALSGYLSVQISGESLMESIGTRSALIAKATIDEIDREIEYRLEEFELLAKDPLILRFASESSQQFEGIEDRAGFISKADDEWRASKKEEVTPFMRPLIESDLSDSLRAEALFYKKKYGYDLFSEIFVTNTYGANVAQTNKTSDYFQADEGWWQEAMKNGYSVSDVEFDESANVFSMSIGMRIDSDTGKPVGVMKGVFNIEDIISILKRKEMVASTKAPMDFKLTTADHKMIYATESYRFFDPLPKELDQHIMPFGTVGAHDFFLFDDYGEQELAAYARSSSLRNFKGSGWILVVEQMASDIFGPVTQMRRTLVVSTLFLLAFSFYLIYFISKNILKPLLKLKVAAEEISRGEVGVVAKINTDKNNEIQELANSFNIMTGKLMEKQRLLADSSRLFESMVNNLPAGVLLLDVKQKTVVAANAVARRILGWAESPVGVKPRHFTRLSSVVPCCKKNGVAIPENLHPIAIATKTEKLASGQNMFIKRPKIGLIPVRLECAPILNSQDRLESVLVVLEDVTKEYEFDQSKSEFVSLASHQLRTPLTGIKWMVEAATRMTCDKWKKTYWKDLAMSTHRMIALINNLLNVSRLETEAIAINPEPVDLGDFIKELMGGEAKWVAKEKNQRMLFAKPAGKMMLKADKQLLQQVVSNLVSNAIRYSPKDSAIEIGIEKRGSVVELSVRDHGIGIRPEDQKHLFEKFFRAKEAALFCTTGSGLGLYILKHTVDMMGGSVEWISTVGVGTHLHGDLAY